MLENIYYIIPTNAPQIAEWLSGSVVVESNLSNLRTNTPESLYLIKTKKGDTSPLPGAGVGYTHKQILVEMSKPNWSPNDI